MQYDKTNTNSIISFAKQLKGKTLREACEIDSNNYKIKDKGGYGKLTEKYYFKYEPNSDAEPDFKEAGLELKCVPLKALKNKSFRSKERLVLNIINYLEVHKECFCTSSFWKKNAHLLLVFYLHDNELELIDYVIKLVDDWKFPKDDLKIIKHDWEFINQKIKDGKAHELSEGDTFYLGACTKGSTAKGSLRPQPFSSKKAKQRAYSLKQGYVNHIIANIAQEEAEVYGKIIKQPEILDEGKSLEDIVISKFEPFYGKTPLEIEAELGLELSLKPNSKPKNYYANLTNKILGLELGQKIEEFEKADIQVKTVRLNKNDLPKESISFPTFKYEELVKTEWEDSDLKKILDNKFFFVFYKDKGNQLVIEKVKFWNMPYVDMLKVQSAWEEMECIVMSGDIVKEVKDNGKRYTNFPGSRHNGVCHVRPHARKASDTYKLPVKDKVTGEMKYTKHCFWLNASYIKENVYL